MVISYATIRMADLHKPLTNEQRRELAKKTIHMEVTVFEAEVLREIRECMHGRITVIMLDGTPCRIEFSHSKMLFQDGEGVKTLQKVVDRK